MSGFAINHIVLSGNLTREPELRHTKSGTAVCDLGLANNTRRKNSSTGEWEDRPNFFNLTVWSGMGEWCAGNLAKGNQVVVEGRMEWRQYESNGEKKIAYDVIVDSIIPPSGERRQQSLEPDLGVEEGPPPAAQAQSAASNGHNIGSLEPTDANVLAYCICKPGHIDDKCPIQTHGIPY
jgi:single-strand DNA-binding protein